MELIETVLVIDGKIQNLKYHLKRAEKTYKFFKWKNFSVFTSNFQTPHNIKNGIYRVRVVYSYDGIKNKEIFPVKKRKFKKFKIMPVNFNYSFKYKDRKQLSALFSAFSPSFDEFILVKNNLITDTTISNLAFFTGIEWLTPKYPLLKGTKREELLEKGFLKEENIHIYDLPYFKKMAMINAILGFSEIDEFDIIR